ncbi:Phosphoribosylformylglycinamidine synthase, PurS subunit / Phosphoribosylformylglycinamidine synthase, synthetase subunit [hydrothermal vent metagenome]|uniref:Phosphoribosylformylglycinamidine synthase, PurS subunit / Phosphoribosylformylglycinamidine synthase, synthetase subunit n=1 Tax=hydrothermal vent metagenome TaxID=652676 RepID=A0A3B1DZ19_9ZZZZ
MLWEVEITPVKGEVDREAEHILAEAKTFHLASVTDVKSAKSFLIQTTPDITETDIEQAAFSLLADSVVEQFKIHRLEKLATNGTANSRPLLNVLYKSGVTDNVANSTKSALQKSGLQVDAVATCRKYSIGAETTENDLDILAKRVLANDAIEQILKGQLTLENLSLGSDYQYELIHVAIREMNDEQLETLSVQGQLYLNLVEMQTIKQHYVEQERDPTDAELETIAQTWSEHCSHKTLAGRIHYTDGETERHFENMLKETIFASTVAIRKSLGDDDWCLSVFKDNAGIIKFDEEEAVCFKVETHNHPSALEPYGGANTGIGGVIRDPMGTGLGAKPLCNTDVFCFAPPDTPVETLPPGTLHPRVVAQGVVSGVRDYGNRMGIPTVNGSIFFDDRYLGNPLVYCGNVAMIPNDKCDKVVSPGELIVAVGGRTGRDGIHGATFSSAELTQESETLSGGAVQIGNAITEKMVLDVILVARDRGLYSAITDCGAGGFSSAVGEMGEETGAEVWLERCPLKYAGLTYTEIWISEAQERMVLSVPEEHWDELQKLCESEGVEATTIGKFTDTNRLVLKYNGEQVADVAMSFLHDGRPPVIREAVYQTPETKALSFQEKENYNDDLKKILGSLNVCSKEWVIRQYDHEVQAGSVVKPLVGVNNDGPSDAAVVRPRLTSSRGLVVSNGMNPHYGDLDPYWMAASAIDEAMRNCIAVGADPNQIAILDNFCWGNCDKPEVLGTLVRAALACQEFAIAFGTPFISGKDSLNNEFSFVDESGEKQNVTIPSTLLISALGQIDDVSKAVTMDLKEAGNSIYLVGDTFDELGGSHFALVNLLSGGDVPKVDKEKAPQIFRAMHNAIMNKTVRASHDLSEGGLAVAIAEMAFAGGLGAEISLQPVASTTGINNNATLLFSESNTRFLVEVPANKESEFENHFANLPCLKTGLVKEGDSLIIQDAAGTNVVDSTLAELKEAWQSPLCWD